MNFFDDFARFIDRTVSDYMSGEVLIIGMFFLILSTFLVLVLIHLFSKDFIASESFKSINKRLKTKSFGPEVEKRINRMFKIMPYHFYENSGNLDSLKFDECVPHYESSKKAGKIFFAVFSLVICLISLFTGLSLSNNGLIYLSDAVLIFIFGIIFSLILYSIYIYLKQKAHKKLELNFNEFLKLIKSKKESCEATKNFSQNTIENEEDDYLKEIIESENYSKLLERIKEVKVKGAEEDKIKALINDIANERDKVTDLTEKEYLTDELTDLLNMINKTA